jgi:hypothetical protein
MEGIFRAEREALTSAELAEIAEQAELETPGP